MWLINYTIKIMETKHISPVPCEEMYSFYLVIYVLPISLGCF